MLRMRAGLTQTELARATGLSTSTIHRLGSGYIWNPSVRSLANIALVLS